MFAVNGCAEVLYIYVCSDAIFRAGKFILLYRSPISNRISFESSDDVVPERIEGGGAVICTTLVQCPL